VNGSTEQQESDVTYPYTVAEGRVFVLGDNREVSVDSRTFGSVMNTQIKGKLILYKNRIKSISAE
jgi:signal peptidase I